MRTNKKNMGARKASLRTKSDQPCKYKNQDKGHMGTCEESNGRRTNKENMSTKNGPLLEPILNPPLHPDRLRRASLLLGTETRNRALSLRSIFPPCPPAGGSVKARKA